MTMLFLYSYTCTIHTLVPTYLHIFAPKLQFYLQMITVVQSVQWNTDYNFSLFQIKWQELGSLKSFLNGKTIIAPTFATTNYCNYT